MKADLITLMRFREMRDLALCAPLLTDAQRKECEQRIAAQKARDEAKRAAEPAA